MKAVCKYLMLALAFSSMTASAFPQKVQQPAGPGKTDKELIQGTWKLVAVEVRGRKYIVAEDGRHITTMTFRGDVVDRFTKEEGSKEFKSTDKYFLDPTKRRKTFDIMSIYELDRDDLKICQHTCAYFSGPPREFGGENTVVYYYKRVRHRLLETCIPFADAEITKTPGTVHAPDGKTYAAINDGTLKLFDAATGQERAILLKDTSILQGLKFSPDGKTLAVVVEWNPGCLPPNWGKLTLWNTASAKVQAVRNGELPDLLNGLWTTNVGQ